MQPEQELLRKWEARVGRGRFRPRLELDGGGLVLGAGTILVKSMRGVGRARLVLDDSFVMALLATAYERPIAPYVLQKIRRAAALWNEGEKVLAQIHLAYVDLPVCDEAATIRLFLAEESIAAGVTPAELLTAQGFDPAVAKYSPDQPRVPAGSGRESGRWTDGGWTSISFADNLSTASRETPKPSATSPPKPAVVTAGLADEAARRLIQLLVEAGRRAARSFRLKQTKPKKPDFGQRESEERERLETEQLPKPDPNKLHHIFDKNGREFDEFLSKFDSRETAFHAIEEATLNAIRERKIAGQYKIQVEVSGHKLGVGGKVMDDGTVKIGTAYPWKD